MSTYNIALNFEDGVTRVIQCDDDGKVTDAAFRQKINLPMDCRDGVCGTCKCFVEKGEYELEFYMDESMSDEEAEQGYALTCQMIPESDCVVRVPAASAVCKTAPESIAAEVLGVDKLSETSFGLRVKLAKPMAFLPGQYVNLTVPGTTAHRSYSFSSQSGSDVASFLIRNLPGGVMSTYLSDRTAAAEDDHPRKGFVTDHLTADDLVAGDCDVYLCGPPPMVDAVHDHFTTLGVTPANFYYEKFNPTEAEANAALWPVFQEKPWL